MGYNLSYDYAALVLVSVIIIAYLVKYKKSILTMQGKIFLSMCIILIISTVFHIMLVKAPILLQNHTKLGLNLLTTVYFLAKISLPYLYAFYIIAQTRGLACSRLGKKLAIPMLVSYLFILLSPFNHLVFYIDEVDYKYHLSSFFPVICIVGSFYIIFGFVHLVRNKRVLDDATRLSLQYGFLTVTLISLFLQILYQKVSLNNFGLAICLLMIYFMVETPENIIDPATGVFSINAFMHDTNLGLKNKEHFYILSVTINSQGALFRTLGISFMNYLRKQMADYFKQLQPTPVIYTVSERSFCLLFPKEDTICIDFYLDEIKNRFLSPFSKGLTDIYLEPTLCYFSCPGDAEESEQILSHITHIENHQPSYRDMVLYAKDLNLNLEKRHQKIRLAIQKALKEETFQIFYQPIYSTKEKRITSAEALIRLNDPELGFIPPDEFIPIAEQDGSILAIGDYVLETVCRFIQEHSLLDLGIQYIEINVSVVQCMNRNLSEKVLEIIHKNGLSPSNVNLEITETAASESPRTLQINMERLVSHEVSFSLDDYGTGFSSVDYIVNLPFQLVKLDKSIVWSSFENSKASIAFESTVAMIQKLNMEIVAEGVETLGQAKFLAAIGVEHLQGYYFSKPIPGLHFIEYLKEQPAVLEL